MAGQPYQVHVTPATGATADYRILLFANPTPGAPYWATRADAVADAPHLVSYTAPATGLYGIVVVNDNGGTGNYAVSVTGPAVGVTPGTPPSVSRIVAVQPNPTFAGASIAYTLATPGHASAAIVDLLGRVVAVVGPPPNVRVSGTGELVWDGRGVAGARIAPGVYFATLLLDGRAVDEARIVVLR